MKIIKRNSENVTRIFMPQTHTKKSIQVQLQIIALLLFFCTPKKKYVYHLSLIMELFLSYQIKRSVCIKLQLVNFVPVILFINFSTSAHQKLLTLCNRCYFRFYWGENDLIFCLIYLQGFHL